MGGIEMVVRAVCADLLARLPSQNKKQREGLSLLVATALDVRSVNLNELAAAVPRAAERLDMRYQWISRILGNELINVDEVMAPYAREVLVLDWRRRLRRLGRPQMSTDIRDLIRRMSLANPLWGAPASTANCSSSASRSAKPRSEDTCRGGPKSCPYRKLDPTGV
jgi:hypothetical protein